MFLRVSLLLSLFLVSSHLSSASIDEKDRTLYDHERLGGHTIAKHIDKSFNDLRKRCSQERRLDKATSYYNIKSAESNIADMIKDNKSLINNMGVGKKTIYEQNSWFYDYFVGYGRGINCKKLNKTKIKRICSRRGCKNIKVRLDEIKKLNSALSVIKKTSNDWFVLTSYPK